MQVRRIRDGRQVKCKCWRRATLERERNLVLARLGVMLGHIDRYDLLLQVLRQAGEASAGGGAVGYGHPAGDPSPNPMGER
jgi:hypothetical protein